MFKYLTVFFSSLILSISSPAQTITLGTDKAYTRIVPSGLNLQPQTYAVFNVQFPGGTTTWSDIELKGSLTNFDNNKWFGSTLPSTYATYKDKTQWNALTDVQRNTWLNTNVGSAYRPEWWVESTTDVKEILKKDAWVQANSGPYIFFFSTMLTYDTHYIHGKNDGNLKVWFTAPRLKGSSTVDGRHWVKFIVPNTTTTITTSTNMYTDSNTTINFGGYITTTGVASLNLPATLSQATQKFYSIGNLYTFASYVGASAESKGPASNAVVIVVYYDKWPTEGSAAETTLLNDATILWSDKVYRYVMTKFCKPTNSKLQWCTIFSNSNGFEQKVAVGAATSGSYGESASFILSRVYRPTKPSEWVSTDTAQNMDNILNSSSQNNF